MSIEDCQGFLEGYRLSFAKGEKDALRPRLLESGKSIDRHSLSQSFVLFFFFNFFPLILISLKKKKRYYSSVALVTVIVGSWPLICNSGI